MFAIGSPWKSPVGNQLSSWFSLQSFSLRSQAVQYLSRALNYNCLSLVMFEIRLKKFRRSET
jgi:hypothetical protein